MKTHYKYIHFEEKPNPGKKTSKWTCFNTTDHDELCDVEWSTGWRQYVTIFTSYHTMSYMTFSSGCHADVSDFLKQLTDKQRGKWKSKNGSKNGKG